MAKSSIKTEETTLESLTPDDCNLNEGTERGNAMLLKSLEKFGAGRSILLDRDGRIIAGNKTAEAAASLGFDDVIIIETDGTKIIAVKRTDLSLDDAAARELALADNRTAQVNLKWGKENLKTLLSQGLNPGDFFLEEELKKILGEKPAPEEFKEYGEDIQTNCTCPSCGYQWQSNKSE